MTCVPMSPFETSELAWEFEKVNFGAESSSLVLASPAVKENVVADREEEAPSALKEKGVGKEEEEEEEEEEAPSALKEN